MTGVAVASRVWSTAARNIGTITATKRRRKRARSKAGATATVTSGDADADALPSRTGASMTGMRGSAAPGRAEAGLAALARVERIDDAELGLHDRHDHHLGDALERLDRECARAAVPAAHHQ